MPGPLPDETADPPEEHESFAERLRDAAYEAELGTGRREQTEEELRRHVAIRLVRMVAGFVLIGVGIALLVLPGPGWVMIIVGLSLLPFAWAERTIRAIRRRVPGIPEDGAIPVSTWIALGMIMVGATAAALLFGDAIGTWISGRWEQVWS
jgi:hypothetical protein